MAEFNSVQHTAIAAGSKVLPSVHGKKRTLVFGTPTTAAWAQNDTFRSGSKHFIPKGSRLCPSSYISNSAFGASVTMDVGLRALDASGTEIDLDGIAVGVDIAAAGRSVLNSGALVKDGVDYVTTQDAEVVVTFKSANPTDNAQAVFYIDFICND